MRNRTADRDSQGRRAGACALVLGLVVLAVPAGAQPLPAEAVPLPPVTGP
jgi:hypothetical protein